MTAWMCSWPKRRATVTRRGLEEAEGDGFKAELTGRASPDHHHRLPDRLGGDRPADESGVRVAQDVGGERRVGLEHGDQVTRL